MANELIDDINRESMREVDVMERVKEIYTDPKRGLAGVRRLKNRIKAEEDAIPLRKVPNVDQARMLQKPRKPTKYLRSVAPPYSFQVDILDLPRSRVRFALAFVDILSRKAYMYPLKNKSLNECIIALDLFVKEVASDLENVEYLTTERMDEMQRNPEQAPKTPIMSLMGDDDFNKEKWKSACKRYGITLFTTISKLDHITHGDKLGILNRFVRTFKRLLLNHTSIGVLTKESMQDLLLNYNTSVHSQLGMTPMSAFTDLDALRSLRNAYNAHNREVERNTTKFEVGDPVRVVLERTVFEKENYRFSKKVYHIHKKDFHRYIVCGTSGDTEHTDQCKVLTVNADGRRESVRRLKPIELLRVEKDKEIVLNMKKHVPTINATLRKEGLDVGNIVNQPRPRTKPPAKNRKKKKTNTKQTLDDDVKCDVCDLPETTESNDIVMCDGCERAYHQLCHEPHLDEIPPGNEKFFCHSCMEDIKLKDIKLDKRSGISFLLHLPVGGDKWIPMKHIFIPYLDLIKNDDKWKQFLASNRVELDAYCHKHENDCLFDLYVIEHIDDVRIAPEGLHGQKENATSSKGKKRLMFLVKWEGFPERDWRAHASLLVGGQRPAALQVFLQDDPKWKAFRASRSYASFYESTVAAKLLNDVPKGMLGQPIQYKA